MAAKGYDLTKGSILKNLMLIAMPVIGTQLFQMMYNLIDMFFVGRISSDAVAAVGSAGMYVWLSAAFSIIGGRGAEIGVSQKIGSNDLDGARKFAVAAMGISIVLGGIYGLIMFLFAPFWVSLIRLQEAHVIADTILYLRIISFTFPLFFINMAITGTYNGMGNSRLPFYIKTSGLVMNVILTPILIFTFDLGIKGAAYGTAFGFALTGLLLTIAMKHSHLSAFENFKYKEILTPDKPLIKQIFKWTFPITIDSATFTMLSMIIVGFVAGFGSSAVAAQRVGTQIESLSWLVGGGYAVAFTAFVGQNHGAEQFERIKRGFWLSAVAKVLWGTGVGFLMFFGGGTLFRIFLDEPEIVAIGVSYMRILALVQVAQCMEALCAGAFDGAGKTIPPTVVSMTFNFLRMLLAFFLSRTALGLDGIWIGIAFGNLMKGLVLTVWYLWWSKKTHPTASSLAKKTT